jgi:hypothetical protein
MIFIMDIYCVFKVIYLTMASFASGVNAILKQFALSCFFIVVF